MKPLMVMRKAPEAPEGYVLTEAGWTWPVTLRARTPGIYLAAVLVEAGTPIGHDPGDEDDGHKENS